MIDNQTRKKYWILFALLFFTTSTGLNYLGEESITITLSADQDSNAQVFYPENGVLSEEKSRRFLISGGTLTKFRINADSELKDRRVRLDLSDEPQTVKIHSIYIEELGWKKTELTGAQLGEIIRITQMGDRLKIQEGAIAVQLFGNDGGVWLQLPPRYTHLSAVARLLAATLAATIISTSIITWGSMRLLSQQPILTFAALFGGFISLIYYPGFMSYDTLHALRGARYGVNDSIWPPMVSYIWWVVDSVYAHPFAMYALQVVLFVFSVAAVLRYYTKSNVCALLGVSVIAFIPPVMGTLAAIWKDVLMAAIFLSAFLLTLYSNRASRSTSTIALALAVFLLFLGVCVRHNAILAAAPLAFFWASSFLRYVKQAPVESSGGLASRKPIVAIGVAVILTCYGGKMLLDRLSLPTLERFPATPESGLHGMLIPDIMAASICSNTNHVRAINPAISLEEIKSGYDPRHINLRADIVNRTLTGVTSSNLARDSFAIMIRGILSDPYCFTRHRLLQFAVSTGFNSGTPFLIIDPNVISNEFGYKLPPSHARDAFVFLTLALSSIFIFKSWFILTAGALAYIFSLRVGFGARGWHALFLSGTFYTAGWFVMGNAGDARLLFYSNVVALIILWVSFNYARSGRRE